MQIAIGSDHAGFELKQHVSALLQVLGHGVSDLGTYNVDSADYVRTMPRKSGWRCVVARRCGIVICGSGVGASVAAKQLRRPSR